MADKHNMFIQALGRYVSGDVMNKREKDQRGIAIAPDKQRIEFGVAVPKTDPDLQRVFGEIATYCNTVWAGDPAKLQAFANWQQTLDGLSMKISDGDKPNKQGRFNDNTKGCFVFWFSSGYPPKASNTAMQEIDLASIKRGDYVHMSLSISDNGLPLGDGAGIYMNPAIMMLVFEGEAITGGVDAGTAFAGMQVATHMPAGAKPLGSAMGAPGGVPGAIPGNPAPGGVPGQPQTAPAAMPGAPVSVPGSVPGSTASPSSVPGAVPGAAVGATPNPHTGILAGPAGGVPGAVPGVVPGT